MKHNFKKGDRVECVSVRKGPHEQKNWAKEDGLAIGKIYTVTSSSERSITVSGTKHELILWAGNFKLAIKPEIATARLFKSRNGQFRFTLKATNGEPIATSHGETYTTKAMALKTLRKYFPEFELVDETKS